MNFVLCRSLGLFVIAILFVNICTLSFASVQANNATIVQAKLAALEIFSGGQIGVSAINTANNTQIQYRSEKRFPFQSTFKVIAVSAILKQSMTNPHLLQKRLFYKKQDIVFWSPITKKHLADGMTISELCAAAMMFSDNTAINLLIKKLGGLKAVNAFAHSLGNNIFKLVNWEPKLNSNPNDLRDTSTPAAMAKVLEKLAFGKALALSQRKQLLTWMRSNTTGDLRIRSGVPKGWVVADKTGSGDYGVTNDIGIIWPPNCAPIVVAIYFVQDDKDAARADDLIASATRILMTEFSHTNRCIKVL